MLTMSVQQYKRSLGFCWKSCVCRSDETITDKSCWPCTRVRAMLAWYGQLGLATIYVMARRCKTRKWPKITEWHGLLLLVLLPRWAHLLPLAGRLRSRASGGQCGCFSALAESLFSSMCTPQVKKTTTDFGLFRTHRQTSFLYVSQSSRQLPSRMSKKR